MEKSAKENIFLNERLMKSAAIAAASGIVISIGALLFFREVTMLVIFEKLVKLALIISLYVAFTHYQWDMMRGLMGGVLLALMYEESFRVLGSLLSDPACAEKYLVMGVQGSLFVSFESMSFLMTVIITLNHFIMNYGRNNNWRNVVFNQISILFKIILYVSLAVINIFIDQPGHTLFVEGLRYVIDVFIIITLICIESQLENFKILRQELLMEKRQRRAKDE